MQIRIYNSLVQNIDYLINQHKSLSISQVVSNEETLKFTASLETFYSKFQSEVLSPASPMFMDEIVPYYILLLGTHETEGTFLFKVAQEFNSKVVRSLELHVQFKKYLEEIRNNENDIKRALFEIAEKTRQVDQRSPLLKSNWLEMLYNFNDEIDKFGAKNIFIFNLFIIVLVPINCLTLLFYAYIRREQKLRHINNLMWNFFYFVSAFFLVTGAILSATSDMMEDVRPVNNFIYGNENLKLDKPAIIKDGELLGPLLNFCINGNSKLNENFFEVQVVKMTSLSKLYSISVELNDIFASVRDINSSAILENNQSFDEYSWDLAKTGENDQLWNGSPYVVMQILRRLTDVGYQGSYIASCSSNKRLRDVFVASSKACPFDFKFVKLPQKNSNNCFELDDWSVNVHS